MSEEELASQVLQYVAGEMPEGEQRLFEMAMQERPEVEAEVLSLRTLWQDLGLLPKPEPSAAMRAQFYQKLNALQRPSHASRRLSWKLLFQAAGGLALFLVGLGVGHFNSNFNSTKPAPAEISDLKTQVEGLRQTVALSLMDKQSASSRLQGVEWSSQVDRPDQELLTALLTTLNHDQNINVRLASLDALEKFTSDAGVRKSLEQSIPNQQSPLLQIALIDALVHIHDSGAAGEFKQLSGNTAVNAAVRERAHWAIGKLTSE